MDNGASLAEINPLVTTPDGKVLALDAKISIDDNELFWRPDLGVLRDDSAEEPSEAAARRANLSFIKLDGNVGCVVNGAGLAMATMDLVKYYGGEPANFLDIGGSSSPEKVINALKIITADPHVKAILFNIFGGITRTDDVANGIVAATSQFKVDGADRDPPHRHQRGGGDPHPQRRRDDRVERHGRGGAARGAAGPGGGMSIFADASTRLVVQGITGREGSFHARQMIEYGTQVVAGVTPGKGGQTFEGKVPIFNTVAEAVRATGANTSVIYVPPMGAAARDRRGGRRRHPADRVHHRGHPGHAHEPHHALRAEPRRASDRAELSRASSRRAPGPRSASSPATSAAPAGSGLVSRSGTLTYEVVNHLTRNGIGQSTCVGIGGDPIIGTNFIDCLAAFEADPETDAIVMIGEIGGTDEQNAAAFVKEKVTKPVMGFIAGQTAPKGRRMGHAGAIISGSSGTAEEKLAAFENAGIGIMRRPVDVVQLLQTRKAGKVKSKK